MIRRLDGVARLGCLALGALVFASACKKPSANKAPESETTAPGKTAAADPNAVPGVTADEIKVGMTGPFTGFNAG